MDGGLRFSDGSSQWLEAVPDGIVVVARDGRIVAVNRHTVELSGYEREELVGMKVEDLVPEALRSAHLRQRAAYQRRPSVRPMGSHLDIRCRRKDGSEFPADIALSPVQTEHGPLVVASMRDLTERKLAEAELLRAQERFRLLVEGVHDYAILMLDPQGRVSSWNRGAERIHGFSADEIVGRHFSVFYPPDEVARGAPARTLAAASERSSHQVEGWRIRKDGSRFWASVTITAMHDQAGTLTGFAKITRDITERKRLDDRLRALLEVAQCILEGHDGETVLGLVARQARSLVEADLGVVALLARVGDSLMVRAADGAGASAVQGLSLSLAGTLMGRVLASRRSVALTDLSHQRAVASPMLDAAGMGSALILPLTSGEHRLGTLTVANRSAGERLGDADLQLLEPFAAQAAVAIDYLRMREDLQWLAVLRDRERIGRDLHDGAIQALFAVGMGLQGLAMGTRDAGLRQRLEDSVAQIDDVIRDLRNYIFGLRPGAASGRHLSQALRELAAELEEKHGVPCAVDLDERVASRLANQAGDLVQLTREALSNVGRHAAARTCRLSLKRSGESAVLEIEDDGRGFVPEAARGRGWGLRNLEDRAASLGGVLKVASVPGQGTEVQLTLPLP